MINWKRSKTLETRGQNQKIQKLFKNFKTDCRMSIQDNQKVQPFEQVQQRKRSKSIQQL